MKNGMSGIVLCCRRTSEPATKLYFTGSSRLEVQASRLATKSRRCMMNIPYTKRAAYHLGTLLYTRDVLLAGKAVHRGLSSDLWSLAALFSFLSLNIVPTEDDHTTATHTKTHYTTEEMKLISSLTATTAILIASAGQIASALPASNLHRRQAAITGLCKLVVGPPSGHSMLFYWVASTDPAAPAPTIGKLACPAVRPFLCSHILEVSSTAFADVISGCLPHTHTLCVNFGSERILLKGVSANAGAPLWSAAVPPSYNALIFDYVVENDQSRKARLFWNKWPVAEQPTWLNSAANLTLEGVPNTFEGGFIVDGKVSSPSIISASRLSSL